jgi:hypothetical protein
LLLSKGAGEKAASKWRLNRSKPALSAVFRLCQRTANSELLMIVSRNQNLIEIHLIDLEIGISI